MHLILGGALFMPYFLLAGVVGNMLTRDASPFGTLRLCLLAYGLALPVVAVTALFRLVRPMSVAAARAMCAVPGDRLADGPARSWAARGRTSAWWTLHLGVGAVLSGLTLAVPPMALVLLLVPFWPRLRQSQAVAYPWFADGGVFLAPFAGLALLAALAGCAAAAGALLARLAPVLLGPTPADRLAAAEERAADLAVRNRLARELHDSVGHALSAVTLQAVAARRVLDTDREFVREALAAIEETTRRTVGELDTVLGLLRDGDGDGAGPDTAPAPTLAADLDGLLERTRAAGIAVEAAAGDWSGLPQTVSREAYRIVQEGLSNALKHGKGPVTVRISAHGDGDGDRGAADGNGDGDGNGAGDGDSGRDSGQGRDRGRGGVGKELEIVMSNPTAGTAGADPAGREGGPGRTGGRGLRGIRERAALLGGGAEAGECDGHWRLRATLPLTGPPVSRP